jgi:aspartyl-tRNA(Asn)/glutamyl-tRNA(Gln) amidotransferase subunit C
VPPPPSPPRRLQPPHHGAKPRPDQCPFRSDGAPHPCRSTPTTAAKVAKLARIRVEEEDLAALAQDFNAILGFIEQLGELDVEDVEPMTSVTPMRLKRREDVVTDGDQQAKVLSNAPDAREGFFAVPKVVE